jgi:hypothetical protein
MESRAMALAEQSLSIKGKRTKVPCVQVGDVTITLIGKWLRIAAIYDEAWLDQQPVVDPPKLLAALRTAGVKADLFTFAEKIPNTNPKYNYPVEWDNAAVIPVLSYRDWWENRLPQESRRNVRLARKRGVEVKVSTFDDDFVRGIQGIYNECPVRQGRRFWHYGKDFDRVKRENATYLDRSDFLGAFLGDELIGFIKLVYVGGVASVMQILSKNAHYDKKPTNALLAKAVELCAEKSMSHLMYCKYVYGNNDKSPLTEFKRRNGFERLDFPRYYIPLTGKGWLFTRLRLYRGLGGLLPRSILSALLAARSQLYRARSCLQGLLA